VIEEGDLLGEAEFLIGDMLKKKKEGLVKQLNNFEKKSVNKQLVSQGTTCTLRYEQIE
jgi:hypothetical protein